MSTGEAIKGETLLLLLNAHHETIPFTVPTAREEHHWERLLDTAEAGELQPAAVDATYTLQGRSVAVLRTTLKTEVGQTVTTAQIESLRKEERKTPGLSPLLPGQI